MHAFKDSTFTKEREEEREIREIERKREGEKKREKRKIKAVSLIVLGIASKSRSDACRTLDARLASVGVGDIQGQTPLLTWP
ncbi:hypothetical protein [Mesotoga sp.]|uniref:hypothetical protein n=1 Tax=Mesotoga sp. TaxID=2053577 RepID=UPI00345E30F5